MPSLASPVKAVEDSSGKDEMNLAEFPISLLSSREAGDQARLVFEGRHGRLTISGSAGPREEGNGLPTATDTDVLIGLLQLTKRANDFTDPTVAFSRYELLKIIRWPDETKSYRRLKASLNRWAGIKLVYEKSWYDKLKRCRVDATFHILESIVIYDRSGRDPGDHADGGEPPASTFSWNKTFFRSCQAGNLKTLDLGVYFSLKSAATKQLYRFLDKLFYDQAAVTFELKELAFGHVGLSPNYTAPRIKEKLAPCLEELERIGFIEPAAGPGRYEKTGHGRWNITFARGDRGPKSPPELPPTPDPTPEPALVRELVRRGVTPLTAGELVGGFPAEAIAEKLEVFDWLIARKDPRTSKSPSGYLVSSIRGGYKRPQGFKDKATREAERIAAEEARRAAEVAKVRARAEELRAGAEDEAADAYLAGLDAGRRAQLEREAFAASGLNPRFFGKLILRDHVKALLGPSRGDRRP